MGPRDRQNRRRKFHICVQCFASIEKAVREDGELHGFPRATPYLLSPPDAQGNVVEIDILPERYEKITEKMLRKSA